MSISFKKRYRSENVAPLFIIILKRYKILFCKIAGQERFRKSMISHYYRNVHAVIFVYDVTNLNSFENISFWIDEYNKNCGNNQDQIPKILVGNKCDLNSEIKVK